ncbi:Os01g0315850, partial [Oryza sativa Japonica Group]
FLVAKDAFAEVGNHEGKALTQGNLGLPAQELFRTGDVRLALVWIIRSVRTELNASIRINGVLDNLSQLQHGELTRITQVKWSYVLPFHQAHQPFHQIRDILKAPSLLAITIDSQRFLPHDGYLSNKVADNTAIINAHARTICVKNPSNPNLKVGTTVVIHGQRFSCALALIIAASNTNGVDIAPVSLHLRVLEGISIYLTGAGEEKFCPNPLGQSKHVQCPNHVGYDGLDGVVLVVHGASGAGEVVDLVDLEQDGLDDVVADHLESRVGEVVRHVVLAPREEVVDDDHAVAALHQAVHEVAPDEPGAARDEHPQRAAAEAQRHLPPGGLVQRRRRRRRERGEVAEGGGGGGGGGG